MELHMQSHTAEGTAQFLLLEEVSNFLSGFDQNSKVVGQVFTLLFNDLSRLICICVPRFFQDLLPAWLDRRTWQRLQSQSQLKVVGGLKKAKLKWELEKKKIQGGLDENYSRYFWH